MSPADRTALTDRLLLEHGEFDPFEFLLRADWLDYADFCAWQRGEPLSLQAALQVPTATAITALEDAIRHVRAQGLQRQRRTDSRHDSSTDPHFMLLCSNLWTRPAGRVQGDLFQDSAAAFARDELRAALACHDHAAAMRSLARLRRESPREATEFASLLDAIDGDATTTPIERLDQIEHRLAPAAQGLLGSAARRYLAPLWVALAERLAQLPPDSDDLRLHPSHAWMAAGHWRDAAASITGSARDWTREPALIARLATIQARQQRIGESRQLRMQLCWQFPKAAAPLLDALDADDPDSALRRRWPEFRLAEPPLPIGRFPAWLLLADARQREWLLPDQPPVSLARDGDRACYRTLHHLLEAPDDIPARRELKALQPELLHAYLTLRDRGAV